MDGIWSFALLHIEYETLFSSPSSHSGRAQPPSHSMVKVKSYNKRPCVTYLHLFDHFFPSYFHLAPSSEY
uniref:Uncharacterized protein n=1 Tax=Picea sitchensis TaxID=3332 RepID=A0A6B9XSE1_PICSI|nr:hypothetical protein Q903MT_gene3915 [Picea sitchensis]